MNNYIYPDMPPAKIVGVPSPEPAKTFPSGAPNTDMAKFGTPQKKEFVKPWKPLGRKG